MDLLGVMPPATAQNRPFYINLDPDAAGRLLEFRPALVNGVLQWVLRPVYTLGAVGFVIEFGGVCYQDTYPDVSCVYPAGYTYPDVS